MRRSSSPAPASKAPWLRILGLFTVASFVEAMFYGQVGAFTPLYLPHLGVPPQNVAQVTGMIVAVAGLIGIPFLPLWGALADRYSRQPIIVRSYVVELMAAVIIGLAGNVWVFVIGRALGSLSLGNSGLMMTTLTENSPSHRHGLAFSIMNTATPVGVFLGPLLGGPIVDRWGFPALMAIDAALLVALILGMSLGYRDPFRGTSREPLGRMAVDSVRIVAKSPRVRTLFLGLIILFAGFSMGITYVPLAVTSLYSGPDKARVVGLVVGLGGFVVLIFGPLLGSLADRFGLWRVLFIAALVEAALWPVPSLVTGLAGFTVAWALLNGLASSVFALSFTVMSRSASSGVRGRVMSFAYLPLNIGGILGPAIGSLITRQSVFIVFPVAGGLTLLAVLTLAAAYRQKVTE